MVLNRFEMLRRQRRPHRAWQTLRAGADHLTDWREALRHPHVIRELLIPKQNKVLEYLAPEAMGIIETLVGYPVDPAAFKSVASGNSPGFTQEVKGGSVIAQRTDGMDIARAYRRATLEERSKLVGIVGWDMVVSDIFNAGPYTPGQVQTFSAGGQTTRIWDEEGRARIPDELFREQLKDIAPGKQVQFADGEGNIMHATILPLQADSPMPRFVWAADKQETGNYLSTARQAIAKRLAILVLVKTTHLGIARALFWKDAHGQSLIPTRVTIRDERGNLFTFDGTHLNDERFARENQRGVLDVIIEHHQGNLEPEYLKYQAALKNPPRQGYVDPRFRGYHSVTITDVTRRGQSLRAIDAKPILEITPCPPVALTFSRSR